MIHLSYSVIVSAVCHVTSMARCHGKSKGKRSKITVALKKLTLGGQLEYFKLTSKRVNSKTIVSMFISEFNELIYSL